MVTDIELLVCERCDNDFVPSLATYNQYYPPYFSELSLDKENFYCGEFYKTNIPYWTMKKEIYLCDECKTVLKNILKEFFLTSEEEWQK